MQNTALILAEQTDRAFQSLDLVETSLIDRIQGLGIKSSADYELMMSGEDIELMLKDKINGLPHVDAVTMINADGNLINFSRYWPIPKVNVSDRDYYKALRDEPNRERFISEPVPNRGTGTWTIYLARRVSGPHHEFLGLVLGAMQLKYFEDFYQAIDLGSDSSIALFRRDAVLLARYPHLDAMIGRAFGRSAVFDVLAHGDAGTRRQVGVLNGQDSLIAVHALAHYPLAVAVTNTERAALAEWWNESSSIAALSVVLCIMIAAMAWAVIRMIQSNAARLLAEHARIDAEAELLKKQRLSVLGELTATVAHELRNPLSVVRNTIFVIAERIKDQALERPIERMQRSIARCDGLIQDLLEYTRTRTITVEPVGLDGWLEDVIGEQALDPRIEIERRFAAGSAEIAIDGDRFRRVIINLVDNAAEALLTAGARPHRITVSTWLDARQVVLTIGDNGPGIPADILPKVFEPLFSTKSFGTGLGLATVRHLVEQHRGTIEIASESGKGTVVTVRLPIAGS
ncbi:MAG TPA: ATP-binding protein [Stellaceae bacterium]|nr:ATP-binding protein [Stellaceae bacterium]